MVYKKYIERDGKIYGPYIYHSKRVDGKVVSEYKGAKKGLDFNLDSKNLKFLAVALGIFFLIGVSYVVYNGDWGITGDVISGTSPEEILFTNKVDYTFNPDLNINVPVKGVSELTAKEKSILEREIGDFSVEIEKAVVRNGFLIVRYTLGDYWIEFNYEEDIDDNTLNKFMEADRIKWLKDLSRRVDENSEQSVGVRSLNGQIFGF